MNSKFEGIKSLDALLIRRAFLGEQPILDRIPTNSTPHEMRDKNPVTPSKGEEATGDDTPLSTEQLHDESTIGLGLNNDMEEDVIINNDELGINHFFPDANGPMKSTDKNRQQ